LKRSAEVLMEAHTASWVRLLAAKGDAEYMTARATGDDPISQTFWHNAPSVMLSGFALENLLKGILVARDPSRVGSPQKLFDWGHNLVTLAADANIALSADEDRVMRRLTDYTTWAGRYPTANKTAHMVARPDTPTGGATWDGADNEVVDGLYASFRKALQAEIYGNREG
jgi:hypothetical protein